MKLLTFMYELTKFILISVPIACFLFTSANLYFGIKRLIK